MHHISTVLLLQFLGGAIQTGAIMVNLTARAEKYVQKINFTSGGYIDTWGMTDKYDYWTQTKQPKRGHPIKLNVSALLCVPETKGDDVQKMNFRYDCETEFSLYIDKGLQSVFNINTTVSFPLIENSYSKRNVVTVNLNNKEQVHKTIQKEKGRSEIRGCDFIVTVTMDGSFAYHSRRRRRGNYYNVSVKHLKDRDDKVKLLKRGEKLQYNITGSYVETICS
ncbi:hypothetical protein MRX96_054324 [Rhipicephalus microplus]|nr:uncharacterized protein LOC119170508 [Rhipicephalus microplus]